jgi:hypothetical protein
MLRKLQQTRYKRADREGSPQYNYSCGAIAAGGSEYVEVAAQFTDARKYAPMNSLRITNMSTERLTLTINGGSFSTPVPAGVILAITDQPVWTFTVSNDDSANATTAAEVQIQLQRAAVTADELARRTV